MISLKVAAAILPVAEKDIPHPHPTNTGQWEKNQRTTQQGHCQHERRDNHRQQKSNNEISFVIHQQLEANLFGLSVVFQHIMEFYGINANMKAALCSDQKLKPAMTVIDSHLAVWHSPEMAPIIDKRRFKLAWCFSGMIGALILTATTFRIDLSYCATKETGWPFPKVNECPCHEFYRLDIPFRWGITMLYWLAVSTVFAFCLSMERIWLRFLLVVIATPAFAIGLYYVFFEAFKLMGWYIPWAPGQNG